MTTALNIIIGIFFTIGLAFVLFLLYQVVWPRIAWWFKPKAYKKSLQNAKAKQSYDIAKQRLVAKQQRKKAYSYNKGKETEAIVWASSQKIADRKYKQISTKKKRPIEIF